MKTNIVYSQLSLILILLFHHPSSWSQEANHTWAKSEAWAWMGNLNRLNLGTNWSLDSNGYGFIHYFSRNDTGTGHLNFKSSAVTRTANGIGYLFNQKITMPRLDRDDFRLEVREDQVDMEFFAPGQHDHIWEQEITENDLTLLKTKLLPLYSGLKLLGKYPLKKYRFKAQIGKNDSVDLTLYSLWPDVHPPQEQMEFYGIQDSYTKSSPMVLAYGDWTTKGESAHKVAGLCFLDRQWSKDYFGTVLFNNPLDFLIPHHALSWAHSWSAFHAQSTDSKDWYFVHLWEQVKRQDQARDLKSNYSGIQWSKNGVQQASIPLNQFNWKPTEFIENTSKVLFNFAEGSLSYFPFNYQLLSRPGFSVQLTGSPRLQSLDQPVYLYEGYANGTGLWDNHRVKIQGRIESSRILFRENDYRDILKTIDQSKSDQLKIAQKINRKINTEKTIEDLIQEEWDQEDFFFNDLERKLQIFSSSFLNNPQRKGPQVMVYR